MPPPRPKGVGCSTGIVSARPNPNTPMSERQQMALLIQMTASTTDHNRSYQKSKKFDENEEAHAHTTDKTEVKEKADELNVEKKDNNNMELNSGVGMESSSSVAANNASKRPFSDAEDADEGDNDNDDVKRKRRKDSETAKDKQNANVRIVNRNEKNVKAHATATKSAVGSNKNCPTTDKEDGGGAGAGSNNSKNNKTSTYADVEGDENDDLKNDALYSGGLKVPPLKIVIPQQNCTIDTDGSVSRTGKVNTSRNAALPYVVSSNSDCNETIPSNSSPRDSPKVNNAASTVAVAASTTPSSSSATALEEKHGKLSNEEKNLRVLRSSHRSGLTAHERNSNNPSPSQMQSNSPSPASSSCAAELTDNKSNNNSNYNNAPSSPTHQQNVCLENENIVNLPSPSTSSTSSSKEVSGNNVDLHPRKRKIRTKNEDQNKAGSSSSSNNSNTNAETTSICSEASTHDTPFVNCLQMYLNIRRQTDKNRKNVFPVKPRPPPQGFNEYLMNTKKYLLHTNQTKTTPIVPEAVPPIMKEIFLIQEKERTQLQQRHTVEREKLCLNVEQEILRVHSKAARSIAGQTLPYSVCTYIKDEEVYNMMALEQDEKDKNARHRFNGRLLISWLQDVDDKWEKIKESMILRHHNEAESLHAVQLMDWEIALKKNELFGYDTQFIVENEHVPIVQVEDFDLLPA